MIKEKLNKKKDIPMENGSESFDVYKVKLGDLKYNVLNERIYCELQGVNIKNKSTNETNDIIENLIWEQELEKNKSTKNNIDKLGQLEVGIITKDGVIIDGNRRFTCLRKLQKETNKELFYEAIIVDEDKNFTDKDIKKLELRIQHGLEEKVSYNPVNKALGAYNSIVKDKLITEEEYAEETNAKINDVRKLIKIAELLVEYLEKIGKTGEFGILTKDKHYHTIDELYKHLKKENISDDKKQDIKNYTFATMSTGSEGEKLRIVRDTGKIIAQDADDELLEDVNDFSKTVFENINKFGYEETKKDEQISQMDTKVLTKIRMVGSRNNDRDALKKDIDFLNTKFLLLSKNLKSIDAIELEEEMEELEKNFFEFRVKAKELIKNKRTGLLKENIDILIALDTFDKADIESVLHSWFVKGKNKEEIEKDIFNVNTSGIIITVILNFLSIEEYKTKGLIKEDNFSFKLSEYSKDIQDLLYKVELDSTLIRI